MLKLEDMTSITDAKKNLSHYVKEAAEENSFDQLPDEDLFD